MRDLFKRFSRSKSTISDDECKALINELKEICEQNKMASRELQNMKPIQLDNCNDNDIKNENNK